MNLQYEVWNDMQDAISVGDTMSEDIEYIDCVDLAATDDYEIELTEFDLQSTYVAGDCLETIPEDAIEAKARLINKIHEEAAILNDGNIEEFAARIAGELKALHMVEWQNRHGAFPAIFVLPLLGFLMTGDFIPVFTSVGA